MLSQLDRRAFLKTTGAALITPALPGLIRDGLPLLGRRRDSDAGPPPAGSPRANLLERSTRDSVALYLYGMPGRIGYEYTQPQIATVAGIYGLLTWVYAGSGVAEAAHAANPAALVTEYFDLTWVGDYNQIPGVPWMPAPWSYVNDHENFFGHWAPIASPQTRVPNPIFGYSQDAAMRQGNPTGTPREFLANPFDLDEANPSNADRWINYFTAQSQSLIAQSAMDGLMMDEVSQPYGVPPPWGVTPQSWHRALDRALAFIRAQLGAGMIMLFNGIAIDMVLQPPHLRSVGPWARPASLDYLRWCDGAQMEVFVTSYVGPQVWPQPVWEEMVDLCMAIARSSVLLAQAPILVEDPRMRSFALASFHLVKGDRSYFSHRGNGDFPWYPEWTLKLGAPLHTAPHISGYLVAPGHNIPGVTGAQGVAYTRAFENGIALANPSSQSSTVQLAQPGYLAISQGGGWIGADGTIPAGQLTYQTVQQVDLPAQSGAHVLWEQP